MLTFKSEGWRVELGDSFFFYSYLKININTVQNKINYMIVER